MSENHKSFFDRLVFLPFEDRLDVELAYALAKYWFRAKYRKELDADGHKVRYFEHLRRVVLILIDELHLADPSLIIAALCHDALEDTKEEDLAAVQIEKRFGREVIWMVKLLSKVPKEGYLDRLKDFADWRVLMLKACDRLDNLRSLKAGSKEFQDKQIEETRVKYYPIFDKLVAIAPKEQVMRAAYLRDKIREIADNFFNEV
jgi:GTP pyrophosphokinase